jgi:hypothetical protein
MENHARFIENTDEGIVHHDDSQNKENDPRILEL